MFTWICPKCGAEVPPSETDCPRCNKTQAFAPAPPTIAPAPVTPQPPRREPEPVTLPTADFPVQHPVPVPLAAPPPAAPPPVYAPPAAAPPPQTYARTAYDAPPPSAQTTYTIPPPSQGLPSWLVVLLVALVLIGAGWAGIHFLTPSSTQDTAKSKTESPNAAKSGANPVGRHLEIAGLRVAESSNRKLEIRMIVINHSTAEFPDMKLTVNLRVANSSPEKEPISTFTVRVSNLGALESKEIKVEAVTKLRAYEFPDWQFLKADFDVVSP